MNSPEKICRQEQGALLIHSLVAATILLGCLAIFIQTLILGLRAMQEAEDYTTAVFLVQNKMAPLIRNGSVPDSFKEEGAFDKPYERFKYAVMALPLRDPSAEKEINEVTLTVRWLSGKNSRDICVSSYLFRKND